MSDELNWVALYPELVLAGFSAVLLLMEAVFWPRRSTANMGYLSLFGCLIALTFSLVEWGRGESLQALYGMVVLDSYATFFDILLLSGTALSLLLALQYLPDRELNRGEYYPLFLLATLGMMLMATAADLLVLFLGLELAVLALCVLASMEWRSGVANEAGLKFYLLGALASGFFLYGTSLIYGEVGSTNLQALVDHLQETEGEGFGLLLPGMALMAVGFAFKIAAVPFHMWAPDSCQGSPTPVTAFLMIGPKIAGFAAFARVFLYGLGALEEIWEPLLWALAAATMVGGNLMALNQRNLKRLLAYSGIAHSGYALMGLVAANPTGLAGALFYLFAFALANTGGLAVLVICHRREEEHTELSDYRGLGFCHPWLGLIMAISMLSLAGMPPMVGFWGRFYLLSAAVEAGQVNLALVAALSSLLAAYCHLRVVVNIYRRPVDDRPFQLSIAPGALAVLLLTGLGTLGLGLLPALLVNAVRATVISIM